MSDRDDEKLEKVFIDLPNHWATGGESMWAFKLAHGIYRIDNVPFYAYGINYRDVVETDSTDPAKKPVVTKVLEQGGHETIRVVFLDGLTRDAQRPIIDELQTLGVDIERAFEHYVAIDIPPNVDCDLVRDKLDGFAETGVLEYETCESRVEDGFDAAPSDEADE